MAARKKSKILDIGCGRHKIPGAVGLDRFPLPGIDIVHDLNDIPYPLADDSFEAVYAYHVLEHVADVMKTLEEIYRLTADGGKVYIRVPHASCSKTLWTDPTHRRAFTCRSFQDYLSPGSGLDYYAAVNFKVERLRLHYCLYDGQRKTRIPRPVQLFFNTLANISYPVQELWERLLANYIGGFEELYVELTAVKSRRRGNIVR